MGINGSVINGTIFLFIDMFIEKSIGINGI